MNSQKALLLAGLLVLLTGLIVWWAGRPPIDGPTPGPLPSQKPAPLTKAERRAQFLRWMNIARAHLDNRNDADALEALEEALKLNDRSAMAHRNWARAMRISLDHEAALGALLKAKQVGEPSPATSYLLGLTHLVLNGPAKAAAELEQAVELDPHTAAIRFQLAVACEALGEADKAFQQLTETVRLDPLRASAHYKLVSYAQLRADESAVQHHLREFKRLKKVFGEAIVSRAAQEACIYVWPEAPVIEQSMPDDAPAIDATFVDATAKAFVGEADRGAVVAAVIEQNRAGWYSVFTAAPDGRLRLLRMNEDGVFTATPVSPALPASMSFTTAIAGNYHDEVPAEVAYDPSIHARNDVLLIGPSGARLLERTADDAFTDTTEASGLAKVTGQHAAWIDYDHDGDLDLLVASDERLALWQNNGNRTFTDVTQDVGLTAAGPITSVFAADLNADVAVDVIAGRVEPGTSVFENQRAGHFAPLPAQAAPWPAARRIAVNDLDNDGRLDALLLADGHVAILYGNGANRQNVDLPGMPATDLLLLDYDNDGRLDLAAIGTASDGSGNGAVRLWRNAGVAGVAIKWQETTQDTALNKLALPPVRAALAVDLDHDRDTDLLLITTDNRLHFIANEGGNANEQLQVRLLGTKTNTTGLGTRVELRQGAFVAVRQINGVPVEIGVGGRRRLDTMQTVWATGAADSEIDVPVGAQPLATIEWTRAAIEANVATGSCPFLYAWDGDQFLFVTDVLGNAPVGLSLRRNVLLPADDDEYVVIGSADGFVPRDGAYRVEITSEFNEVLYLDTAQLVAVDHPADVEIHVTDKIEPAPFPPSQLRALTARQPMIRALGSDGRDYTDALRTIDGAFTSPGVPLGPPYRGMCQPMSFSLDFPTLDTSRPLVLALTGWLQYGQASANIAMSQNPSLTIIPPILEVQTDGDQWQPVDVTVGMPAGKTKTILVILAGKLPVSARRLRLTTTFEIRWDRIAMFERTDLPEEFVHRANPAATSLRWRGFSEIKSRQPGHPTTPDYNVVSDRPPWRTALQGWCTRYGDVQPLVTDRDDQYLVMNGGDALSMHFGADAFSPTPDGLERTWLFYSVGYEKDGDHNVVGGDRVAPMPTAGPTTHHTETHDDETDWQLEYNTRWVPFRRFDPHVRNGSVRQP